MSIKRLLKKFMLFILIITVVLFIALVVWFFILGQNSQSGSPPGLVNDRLAQCPETPNCVCSEYTDDSLHYIKPVSLMPDINPDLPDKIQNIVSQMGGKVHQIQNNYLAATFTSSIFRFVDDFEVRINEQHQVIHVRSASRVGKGDLGVNRKRVEQFRDLFLKEISANP